MALLTELQTRIAHATEQLGIAEQELAAVIEALQGGERADKTMISSKLQDAFAKLASAKAELAQLVAG
jgi:RNA polymerase-interacting CarD/CdnL/TRCF family regulator